MNPSPVSGGLRIGLIAALLVMPPAPFCYQSSAADLPIIGTTELFNETTTIGTGDTLTLTASVAGTAAKVYVGSGADESGELVLTADGLIQLTSSTANSGLIIGNDGGTGLLSMSGGTINLLSDPGHYNTFYIGLGNGSGGTFNQSAGTVSINGSAFGVGVVSGTGVYTLSGTAEVIAAAGSSIFIGSDKAADSANGGDGTVNISDSARFIIGTEATPSSQIFVGGDTDDVGTGRFVQNGASSEVSLITTNRVHFGYSNGGIATYTLNDGSLTMGSAQGVAFGEGTGSSGTLTQNGGS